MIARRASGSASSGASHVAQSSGATMTGIRSWSDATASVAARVTIVNVLRRSAVTGSRQLAHSPAKANGRRSARRIRNAGRAAGRPPGGYPPARRCHS